MTQLSLFDAPVPTTVPSQPKPVAAVRPSESVKPVECRAGEHEGPQRMGNLAYLVLARYDMVAARREAQRRAAAKRRTIVAPAAAD